MWPFTKKKEEFLTWEQAVKMTVERLNISPSEAASMIENATLGGELPSYSPEKRQLGPWDFGKKEEE